MSPIDSSGSDHSVAALSAVRRRKLENGGMKNGRAGSSVPLLGRGEKILSIISSPYRKED